jgi:phosphoglycolate phosphatase-like HAD superfamily hydrolase
MFTQAAADLGLDLGASAMVGDSPSDMEAARRVGALRVLVGGGGGETSADAADFVAAGLDDAATWLLGHRV